MKYLDLVKQTTSNSLSGSYFIEVDERYLYDSIENILVEDVVVNKDFNYEKIDGEEASLDEIITSFEMLPVFSDKRYVIVKNIDFSKDVVKKNEKFLESLSKYFDNPNESTVIFLVNLKTKPFKSGKYFKKIISKTKTVNIERLNKKEFSSFVVKFFKKNNKDIGKSTVQYIIDQSGYFEYNSDVNLYDIENELKNIRDYSNTKVTTTDVVKVKLQIDDDNIFNFLDQLSAKNYSKSLSLFRGFQRQNMDNFQLFYMIVRQFRNIYYIKLLKDKGIGQYEGLKLTKISKYEYGKLSRINSFSSDDLRKIHGLLFNIEKRMKTVNPDFNLELEILIARICTI